MTVVLLPILDILPFSALIIMVYVVYAFLWRPKLTVSVDQNLLHFSNIWLGFSLFGISAAFLTNYANSASHNEPINYLIRVILIYTCLLATNVILMKEKDKSKVLEKCASLLFSLIVISALFEFGLKAVGDRSILSLYKARQDLGGFDTLHFNRFTGFWSYPGDAAAVIVLSIALTFAFENKYKILKTMVLLGLLVLTQSKAGIAFVVLLALFYWIINFKIFYLTVFSIFSFFLGSYVFLTIESNFEYLQKFITNLPFYLQDSKRATEILLFRDSDLMQKIVGLKNPYYMYESEIFGSLSRVGILGSLWIFVPIYYVCSRLFYTRKYLIVWLCLFLFLTIYLSISAGISRFKILIPYLVVFFAILLQEKYDKTS